MKILVTGAAGFIGSRVAYMLAQRGDEVVGIDNINDYYDVQLKYGRLKECGIETIDSEIPFDVYFHSRKFSGYKFIRLGIEDMNSMEKLFRAEKFDRVVNLAAQAGVRYSITNPDIYITSNIVGFTNILECCRHNRIKYLLYASSSSVYGLNSKTPFSEDDEAVCPVSLYAATKKSNELMAHAYSSLYDITTVGLRYFTVYGPWGRPDMAPMLFAKAISEGTPIKVFNNGNMNRDFTYIDDIVKGTVQVLDKMPELHNFPHEVPYKIYNIGCSHPVKLMDFIREIEDSLGCEAKKNYMPMQQGDVLQTFADMTKLIHDTGYKPSVSLHEGIQKFMDWYKSDKNPLK